MREKLQTIKDLIGHCPIFRLIDSMRVASQDERDVAGVSYVSGTDYFTQPTPAKERALMLEKLETIKDLIEAQGGPLEGDLHGSNLEEVYRLVIELIEEETCAETSSCTKALEA